MLEPKEVFILEDDKILSELLSRYLTRHKYKVSVENDGSTALRRLQDRNFDIILLDITVPGLSGIEVLTELRDRENLTPVIMITGNFNEEKEIQCFEKGTNLFHKKPIKTRLLLKQIESLTSNGRNDKYKKGEILIDDTRKSVTYSGKKIKLTKNEYRTLLLLVKRGDKITTKDRIIENLYFEGNEVLESSVDTHISRLRKKLFDGGVSSDPIETVRGFGYKISKK